MAAVVVDLLLIALTLTRINGPHLPLCGVN